MYAGISLDQAPPEDIPIRFFISAPFFGILAGLHLMWEGEILVFSNWSTSTIAFTHLFTLGWLAMIMIGSFYQMVPVLVGGTVPHIMWARKVHAVLSAGVLLLVCGIHLESFPLIVTAFPLLLISLSFFIFQVGIALLDVKADRPTVLAMRISVLSLLFTVAMGLFFAGSHAGLWDFPAGRMQMTAMHVVLGLFGWVGSLIMGVGFHVIPMFYMTPSFPSGKAFDILLAYTFSLVALPLALLAEAGSALVFLAGMPALYAMLLFSWTVHCLIRDRKRKITDVTLKAWKASIYFLPAALAALIACQFTGADAAVFSFGIIFIVGFGLTVTTGMLYKILPFLVWFHRFSMLIGKVPVPLMKDISPDRPAWKQLRIFWFAAALFLAGAVLQSGLFVRLAGLFLFTSSILFMVNLLVMIRMKVPELPPAAQSEVL